MLLDYSNCKERIMAIKHLTESNPAAAINKGLAFPRRLAALKTNYFTIFVGYTELCVFITLFFCLTPIIDGQTANKKSALKPAVSRAPRLVPTLGPAYVINSAAFSDDGSLLVTGSSDGVIILWDMATGNEARRFVATTSSVIKVEFFDHDKKLLIGSEDGVTQTWDLTTFRPLLKLNGYVGTLAHDYLYGAPFAVSTEGTVIFTADKEGVGHLWNSFTGKERMKLPAIKDNVGYAAFSPDGKRLLIAAKNDGAKLYNLSNARVVWAFHGDTGAVAFSANGDRVITSGNGSMHLRDAKTGHELKTFSQQAFNAALSPDGRFVLANDFMNATSLWDTGTGKEVWTHPAREQNKVVAFSRDSKYFVTSGVDSRMGSRDSKVRVWETLTQKQVQLLEGQTNKILAIGFQGGYPYVLGSDKYNAAYFWSEAAERRIMRFEGHFAPVDFGDVSPDGKNVMLSSLDQSASLWDAVSGEEKFHFPPSQCNGGQCIWDVSFSHDSRHVYLAGTSTRKWDVLTGSLRARFGDNVSMQIGTSSDDKLVITYDLVAQGRRVYSAETGDEISVLKDPKKQIKWNISPDGRLLLAPCMPNLQGEFNTMLGAKIACIPAPNSVFALSPDATRIVTGDVEGNIRVFDDIGLKELNSFRQEQSVNLLEIASDNRMLLTASAQDNTVRLWDIRIGKELARITTFQNGTWVVTDLEGRFDTNNIEGARGLSWVLEDEPLRPLPLEIFSRDYYTPQLLRKIIDGEKLAPIPSLESLNRVQPRVKILSVEPESGDTSMVSVVVEVAGDQREYTRDGKTVSNATGANDLRLFRDGQLVAHEPKAGGRIQLDPQTRKTTLTLPHIQLPLDGSMRPVEFSAYAFNDSRVKSETDRFKFTRPKKMTAQKGRAYVVTFGVNLFDNEAWNLSFAANDARGMSKALTQKLDATNQYLEVVPISLVSAEQPAPEEAKATKKNIEIVLKRLAGEAVEVGMIKAIPNLDRVRKATPQDLIVISFSTHGYADESSLFYLLPQEVGRTGRARQLDADTFRQSISSDELATWLQGVDAGEMVMVIDACHSAAITGGEFKPGPMGSRGLGQLAYDKHIKLLAATQSDSIALEYKQLQHGILTYALIDDGLERGSADFQPKDTTITLTEWLAYGVARVPQLSAEILKGQRPAINTTAPKGEQKPKDVTTDSAFSAQVRSKGFIQRPSLFDFKTKQRVVNLSGPPFFEDSRLDIEDDPEAQREAIATELEWGTKIDEPDASTAALRRFIARHPLDPLVADARIRLFNKLMQTQAPSPDLISAYRMALAYITRENYGHLASPLFASTEAMIYELIKRNEYLDNASRFVEDVLDYASEMNDIRRKENMLRLAARLELKRGRADQSILILSNMIDNAPDDQQSRAQLADTYEALGEIDRAVETYVRAAADFDGELKAALAALRALYEKRHGSLTGFEEKLSAARKAETERLIARHRLVKKGPPWRLRDVANHSAGSSSYAGKVAVVAFWGTWNNASSTALKSLQDVKNKFAGRGIVFLAIDVEEENDPAKQSSLAQQFASSNNLRFPYVIDHKLEAARLFEVEGVPTFFVIDSAGNIRYRINGLVKHFEQILEAQLNSLLTP
jgi:WD40 repeat protein/peroxiredoxin